MYHISEISNARADFGRLFELPLGEFLDNYVGFLTHRICIDIVAFDNYLHKLYGDYEDAGFSMQDLIIEKYGIEADAVLNKLI
ncbi:MAG: hypothetical protein LBC49_03570 [Bacteroidales bacterium]|jgi:hypothetical protein|nr:hypothetical protein [Bacteroidales bacterium]